MHFVKITSIGSDKTYLLHKLQLQLSEHFDFYDRSRVVANVVAGGRHAFLELEAEDKTESRELAIETIQKIAAILKKISRPTHTSSITMSRLRLLRNDVKTTRRELNDVASVDRSSHPPRSRHASALPSAKHEDEITIVALMRGGEPMALSVSEMLPLAMFVLAKAPEGLELHRVERQRTIVVVGSVFNTGKGRVVRHVQGLQLGEHGEGPVRIVVVTGSESP